MDCSKLQKDILNGIDSKDMQEHLSECAECQIFQDSLEQFLTARPEIEDFNPPEKLDYEIKKEARIYIEKHMKAYNAEYLRTPLIPRLSSYFAAAACSALVAWLVIIALQPPENGNQGGNQNGNNVSDSSSDQMSWENVSLDDEFFAITTDIEINHILLLSPSEEDIDEKDEETIEPEEDDWS